MTQHVRRIQLETEIYPQHCRQALLLTAAYTRIALGAPSTVAVDNHGDGCTGILTLQEQQLACRARRKELRIAIQGIMVFSTFENKRD
jgi:hypothetical protein